VLRLGARLTAGLRAPGAAALDRWVPYIYWQHEILRLLEVAGLVGASPVMLEPRIEVTGRDRAEFCAAAPSLAAADGWRVAVLHPGASDPRRRWPAERFAAVGDAMARAGLQVIVVGIDAEQETASSVTQHMREQALNLCGRLSLHGLTGLLARAALVVANDSGPRHLAEAVGTPTVGIFWCGNLINAGPAFRAKHRPHLSWRIMCPVCGKNTLHDPCEHRESFVDEVTVEEVVESALELARGDG
jgi:ADP-heptose:LPS heptosyltransferase